MALRLSMTLRSSNIPGTQGRRMCGCPHKAVVARHIPRQMAKNHGVIRNRTITSSVEGPRGDRAASGGAGGKGHTKSDDQVTFLMTLSVAAQLVGIAATVFGCQYLIFSVALAPWEAHMTVLDTRLTSLEEMFDTRLRSLEEMFATRMTSLEEVFATHSTLLDTRLTSIESHLTNIEQQSAEIAKKLHID